MAKSTKLTAARQVSEEVIELQAMYLQSEGSDTILTAPQLQGIWDNNDFSDASDWVDAIKELEASLAGDAEDEPKAGHISSRVREFMDVFSDSTLVETIRVHQKETIKRKTIACIVMDQIGALAGERINAMPLPGTAARDVKDERGMYRVVTNNPEWYNVPRDNGRGVRKESWFQAAYLGTEDGQRFLQQIDNLKAKIANGSGNKTDHEKDIQTIRSQISAAVSVYRQAVALHHQIQAIGDIDGLELELYKDSKGNWRPSASPFSIYNPFVKREGMPMSVTSFLRIDVAKVKDLLAKKGSDDYRPYNAVQEVLSRAPGHSNSGINVTGKNYFNVVAGLYTALSREDFRAQLSRDMNSENAETRELTNALLAKLYDVFDPIGRSAETFIERRKKDQDKANAS